MEFNKFRKNNLLLIGFLLLFVFSISITYAAVVIVESNPDNTIINIEGQVNPLRCSIVDSNNDGNFEAYWIESNNTQSNALTKCNRNGVNSQGTPITSCCPTGFQCNAQSNNCVIINTPEVSCSDLNYNQCGSATSSMIKKSIYSRISQLASVSVASLNDFCSGNNVYQLSHDSSCTLLTGPCKCKWSGSQSTGRCVDKIVSAECGDPNTAQLSCETRKTGFVDKCEEEGVYELTWIGILYNADGTVSSQRLPWCASGSRTFPCPAKNSIPFFNLWNLLFATGMIAITYLIFSTYKKK